MSTLHTTAQHRDKIRTRLGTGILALSALIALGLALLILPTTHRTTAPTAASIAQPQLQLALTAQTPVRVGCFRDPATHARSCLHTAAASAVTPARKRCFRDPTTHKLLCTPAVHKPAHHRPHHPYSGGVAP